MELGTGIFVSSLFLGTVALFLFTKDRWNWKKVSLYVFGVPVTVILIGGGGYYAYYQYERRPIAQTEYMGLRLGMSKEDVLAIKGLPLVLKTHNARPTLDELPEGFTLAPSWLKANASEVLSYDRWSYSKKGAYNLELFSLDFINDSLSRVVNILGPASVLGISIGNNHNVLLGRFGEPDTIRDVSEESTYIRYFNYKQLNLSFAVEKGKITAIEVKNMWIVEPSDKER